LLRIKDEKTGRVLFVLRDEDEEPVSIDEFTLKDKEPEEDKNETSK
jgi:hypothetical protein